MSLRTERILSEFNQRRNGENALAMAKYLKTDQPFFGIKTPERRQVLKDALIEYPIKSREDYEQSVIEFWQLPERECHYVALDIAVRYKKYITPESWHLFRQLVLESYWWDNLDTIAANLVGTLVRDYPDMYRAEVESWQSHPSLWVRRASILVFLKHKHKTDTQWLTQTILQHANDREFFIRKAIGWVLREYAKTDQVWVRQFVALHDPSLSPLSKREALKNLE